MNSTAASTFTLGGGTIADIEPDTAVARTSGELCSLTRLMPDTSIDPGSAPRRSAPTPARHSARIVPLGSFGSAPPYAAVIRALVEADRIGAARSLLAVALQAEPVDPACLDLARVLAPPTVRARPATEVDRGREYRWLAENAVAYRGQWVAVEGDRLLASAPSLKELLALLRGQSAARRPLLHHLEV